MSEITFINNENANPSYIEDQKKVLDRIETHPYEKLLKQDFCKLVKDNSELVGEKKYETNDNCQFIVDGNKNSILTIKKISHLDFFEKKDNMINKFFTKITPTIDIIDDYYMVDMKTGMAFDASILWKTKVSTKNNYEDGDTVAMSMPKKNIIGGFGPNETGGDLLINKIDDKRAEANNLKNELTAEQINLLNNTILFHESGHKFQFNQYVKNISSDSKLKLLVLLTNLPLMTKLYSSETMSSLKKLKTTTSEQERNATAFSLAIVRRLKGLGLDLARDLDNNQVYDALHHGLNVYEKNYSKIDGPKISKIKKKNI